MVDSFAVLAHLKNEDGWQHVRELLGSASRGEIELHISAINLAEVQYRVLRIGIDTERVLGAVNALPMAVAPADPYIPAVVRLKAKYPIALGDCFAAALAIELECPVLTGDPEFRKLEGEVAVEWLGD